MGSQFGNRAILARGLPPGNGHCDSFIFYTMDYPDYPSALDRLQSLVNPERSHGGPRAPYTLDRMREFLRLLGDPHLRVPAVHVTGTKGKGSVSAMLHSVLLAAGYRAGIHTSPHLHTFRERIRIGREALDEATFAHLMDVAWPQAQQLLSRGNMGRVTHFEMLSAMAFTCFAEAHCDYAVLEVGLGGRLDATNVLPRPLVSILTAIGLDHTEVLGNTEGEIAREKAGIVKPGCPVVSAPQPAEARDVIRAVARAYEAPLTEVECDYSVERIGFDLAGQSFRINEPDGVFEGWIPLLGWHQLENVTVVLAACRVLQRQGVRLSDEAIREGLRCVDWPARLEVLCREPLFVIDGAHNPQSAARLREAVEEYFPHKRLILLFGISEDKDLDGIARELAPVTSQVLACRSRHFRSRAPEDIAAVYQTHGVPAQACASIDAAVKAAVEQAQPGDMILGTGSLFTVAELREHVLNIPVELYPKLERQDHK
jgi:dihydrofolate synthase / folylpolyglutamate synthase